MSEQKKYTGRGTAQFKGLKPGNMLSMTSYLVINKISGSDLNVTDQRGVTFDILQGGNLSDNLVTATMHSADQAALLVKCSRSEIIEELISAGDAIFTVEFRKQVDPKEAFEKVKTGNVIKSHAAQKVDFVHALQGEVRVLRGHLLSTEPHMGRTLVYDLEKKEPRLVDHRTIDRLILKGTEYTVKK